MDAMQSLELLEDQGSKAFWMYLDYLIYEQGSTDPSHHTRLAMVAIQSLGAMRPQPDTRHASAACTTRMSVALSFRGLRAKLSSLQISHHLLSVPDFPDSNRTNGHIGV